MYPNFSYMHTAVCITRFDTSYSYIYAYTPRVFSDESSPFYLTRFPLWKLLVVLIWSRKQRIRIHDSPVGCDSVFEYLNIWIFDLYEYSNKYWGFNLIGAVFSRETLVIDHPVLKAPKFLSTTMRHFVRVDHTVIRWILILNTLLQGDNTYKIVVCHNMFMIKNKKNNNNKSRVFMPPRPLLKKVGCGDVKIWGLLFLWLYYTCIRLEITIA